MTDDHTLLVAVPRPELERVAALLERDGDEHGAGREIRAILDAATALPGEAVAFGYVRRQAIKSAQADDDITGVMVHLDRPADSVPVYLHPAPAGVQDAPPAPHGDAKARVGRKLFEFTSQQDWINRAHKMWRRHGIRPGDTLCIDQLGRILMIGKHFMDATLDDAYPVEVFLLREDMNKSYATNATTAAPHQPSTEGC